MLVVKSDLKNGFSFRSSLNMSWSLMELIVVFIFVLDNAKSSRHVSRRNSYNINGDGTLECLNTKISASPTQNCSTLSENSARDTLIISKTILISRPCSNKNLAKALTVNTYTTSRLCLNYLCLFLLITVDKLVFYMYLFLIYVCLQKHCLRLICLSSTAHTYPIISLT